MIILDRENYGRSISKIKNMTINELMLLIVKINHFKGIQHLDNKYDLGFSTQI